MPPAGSSSNSGSGSGPSDNSQSGHSVNPAKPNNDARLSNEPLDRNQLSLKSDWKSEIEDWEKEEKDEEALADTCGEDESSNRLGVVMDFPHENDKNGNPNFLVRFFDKALDRERIGVVNFDQSCTHLQHAGELGVRMPAFFEDPATKKAYINMSKPERLAYARKNIPVEYIIEYQNAIGNAMVGHFGVVTRNFRGMAGKNKVDITVIAQTFMDKGNKSVKVTVIRDNDNHVTTYPMRKDKFIELNDPMKNPEGFWLFRDKPF